MMGATFENGSDLESHRCAACDLGGATREAEPLLLKDVDGEALVRRGQGRAAEGL